MKKIIKEFILKLNVIFFSKYWISFGKINKSWDKKLRQLIKYGDVKQIDDFTIDMDGIEIWVRNWPYSYGYPHHQGELSEDYNMPKRTTKILLKKFLEKNNIFIKQ